ncbi:ABC transporter substrate-binding protein, partial [Rhodococcus erythropolis]|nr:ABC transporter substrate-binding protein [Rhodococcus erythropolis]
MDRTDAGRLTRRGFLIGTSGALLAFAAACSSSNDEDTPPSGDSAGSITHKFGATELPEDPQRIVSVGYNDQDAILALGGTLVGTFDWYGDYPYGVWPWAQPLLNGATPEIIGTAGTTIQMEKVAATTPDLIVGTYSGLTQAQYDKLSAIAPTVAQPKEFADYGIPWQNQTTIIGEALGQQGKATELIAGVDKKFADVKT